MDDIPFNIVDYIPPCDVDYLNGSTWDVTGESEYVPIVLTGPDGFIYQSQIDIAGWTKEGMTAFFSNQYIQRDGPYTCAVPIPAGGTDTQSARDIVIITDVPLDITNTMIHAGFLDDASDYMTIKFGQGNIFVQSSTSPVVMIQSDAWGLGSGEPTASGTLYVTRICIPHKAVATAIDFVKFPALRYVAQGIATEEPEYVYLNRLRRSYELQQS